MMKLPTPPAPGTPVSSSLIRELVDAIKARTILRGPGYRTCETPNGTVLEIEQPRQKQPAKIPGCFEIRAPKTNGDSDAGGFDNPYYMVGSRIYAAANLSSYAGVAGVDSRKNKIFALLVGLTGASPSASITTATSFSELQEAADSDGHVVYPLYEFGPGGEIKCDLRNVPTMVAKEWMA